MQDKQLYEYAVIRVVPRVEREEFVNVGIIVYTHKRKQLLMKYCLNDGRVIALCQKADVEEIRMHLEAFERIARGDKDAGTIASLDAPSRFRWLTAQRSTVVQTSRVHPGFCEDAGEELIRLCDLYVS